MWLVTQQHCFWCQLLFLNCVLKAHNKPLFFYSASVVNNIAFISVQLALFLSLNFVLSFFSIVTDCSIFMLSTVLQFFKSAVLNFPLILLSDYPTKVISSFKSQLFFFYSC